MMEGAAGRSCRVNGNICRLTGSRACFDTIKWTGSSCHSLIMHRFTCDSGTPWMPFDAASATGSGLPTEAKTKTLVD